jgi:hypothetical protein
MYKIVYLKKNKKKIIKNNLEEELYKIDDYYY